MTAEEYRAELELQYSVTELEYQQESGGIKPPGKSFSGNFQKGVDYW